MMARGMIPDVPGVWIDEYNGCIAPDIAGTITTRIDASNHYFVTDLPPMKEQVPFNTDNDGAAFTITSRYGAMCHSNLQGGGHYPMTAVLEMDDSEPRILTPVRTEEGRQLRRDNAGQEDFGHRVLVPREEPISNTITTVQKDNLLLEPEPKIQPLIPWNRPGKPTDISPTITTSSWPDNNVLLTGRCRIRKLTPKECFRLMDMEDPDIDKLQESGVSKTQQYKLAGNSIVVSVLYHIFEEMFIAREEELPLIDSKGQYLLF